MRHDPAIIHEARVLRQVPWSLEDQLWDVLRDRRFRGIKFRRQAPVGDIVVSFLCAAQGVVILVGQGEHDPGARIAALRLRGLRVLVLDEGEQVEGALSRIACDLDRLNSGHGAGSG